MKTALLQYVLSAILTVCLLTAPAIAWNCIERRNAKEEQKITHAVFLGKLTGSKKKLFYTKTRQYLGKGKSVMVTTSESRYVLTFAVERFWKGAPKRTRTVFYPTANIYTPKIKKFDKGSTYLVYAYNVTKSPFKGTHGLHISSCSRTAKVSQAKKDLADLGKGKVPQS